MGNSVIFKGHSKGLIVVLSELVDFNQIIEEFKHKLSSNREFFKGSHIPLQFRGRVLTDQENEQLMSLLIDQDILGVTFVHDFEDNQPIIEEQVQEVEVKAEQPEQPEQVESFVPEISSIKNCDIHKGMVRSGQHIHSEGTLIVLGDVNPGGVVSAGDNVIVLGSLKGTVKAGIAEQSEAPFVIALDMRPRQIAIKNMFTQTPDGGENGTNNTPHIAYMYDGMIYVDILDSKAIKDLM